jgi:hypothetical protein
MKVETDIIACIFCYQVNYYFTIMYYVIRWRCIKDHGSDHRHSLIKLILHI